MLFFFLLTKEFIKCSTATNEDNQLSISDIPHTSTNHIDVKYSQQLSKKVDIEKRRKQERLSELITDLTKRKLELDSLETEKPLCTQSFLSNSSSDNLTKTCEIDKSVREDQEKMPVLSDKIDIMTPIDLTYSDPHSIHICNLEKRKLIDSEESTQFGLKNSKVSRLAVNQAKQGTQKTTEFDFEKYITEQFEGLEIPVVVAELSINPDSNLSNLDDRIRNFKDNIKKFTEYICGKTSNTKHGDSTNYILTNQNIFSKLEQEKLFIQNNFSLYNSDHIERVFLFALSLVEFEKNFQGDNKPDLKAFDLNKAEFMDFEKKLKAYQGIFSIHELIVIKNIYNTCFKQKTQDGYILYTYFLFEIFFTNMEIILSNFERIPTKPKNDSDNIKETYKRKPEVINADIDIIFLKTILLRVIYGIKDGPIIAKKYTLILVLDFKKIFTDYYYKSPETSQNTRIKMNILYTDILCSDMPDGNFEDFAKKLNNIFYFKWDSKPDFLDLNNFEINDLSKIKSKYDEFIEELLKAIQSSDNTYRKKIKEGVKAKEVFELYKNINVWGNPKKKLVQLYFLDFYLCYLRKLLYPHYQYEIYMSRNSWNSRLNKFECINQI
ncbi:hypothetical protein CWI38_0285p0040 [Hamiltosporidium tvaerminnensis]|uniref:Uncharacterized protein n=1 Tax=Hamiltosporidium tvaerminnensis TaxID=1176355 RepID=A0A4Q9LYW0_9MICR|nr:hypothetical protein CWI38_0285p0040 [Hamiltosporidium tvaerminnensis]